MDVTAEMVFGSGQLSELAEASAAGNSAQIATLITSGVDVNARGQRGVSILQWAFLHKSNRGISALLAHNADVGLQDDNGNTVMNYAAAAEDQSMMTALIEAGANLEVRHGRTGETALFTAIMHDREAQFSALLAAGANVNAVDFAGNTPLHQASKVNDSRRVLALLEAGASPTIKNNQGVDFRRYLNMADERVLTHGAREARAKIASWLAFNNLS